MGKYLEFYKKCMKTGRMPNGRGLCREFGHEELFLLMEPAYTDDVRLQNNRMSTIYWASDSIQCHLGLFTPLRQNIVLFMAAMNDEL